MAASSSKAISEMAAWHALHPHQAPAQKNIQRTVFWNTGPILRLVLSLLSVLTAPLNATIIVVHSLRAAQCSTASLSHDRNPRKPCRFCKEAIQAKAIVDDST
ncbi:hypothetical protein MRX96_042574 [Rhipicephalus microplus]